MHGSAAEGKPGIFGAAPVQTTPAFRPSPVPVPVPPPASHQQLPRPPHIPPSPVPPPARPIDQQLVFLSYSEWASMKDLEDYVESDYVEE